MISEEGKVDISNKIDKYFVNSFMKLVMLVGVQFLLCVNAQSQTLITPPLGYIKTLPNYNTSPQKVTSASNVLAYNSFPQIKGVLSYTSLPPMRGSVMGKTLLPEVKGVEKIIAPELLTNIRNEAPKRVLPPSEHTKEDTVKSTIVAPKTNSQQTLPPPSQAPKRVLTPSEHTKEDTVKSTIVAPKTNSQQTLPPPSQASKRVLPPSEHTKEDTVKSTIVAPKTNSQQTLPPPSQTPKRVLTPSEHTKVDTVKSTIVAPKTNSQQTLPPPSQTPKRVLTPSEYTKEDTVKSTIVAPKTNSQQTLPPPSQAPKRVLTPLPNVLKNITPPISEQVFHSIQQPRTSQIDTNSIIIVAKPESLNSFITLFRINSSKVDLDYMQNNYQYSLLDNLLKDLLNNPSIKIDSIVVEASSSPEGNRLINEALSRQRCKSVYDYIISNHSLLNSVQFKQRSKGEDWSGLEAAVTDDPNVPNKAEVLDIIKVSSSRENKEYFLRRLKDGESWVYIRENILPYLRGGVSSSVYYSLRADDVSPSRYRSGLDTLFIKRVDTVKVSNRFIDTTNVKEKIVQKIVPRPVWAIKTNLVYWAALQPNVEFEFYFGKHWSLNFEYQVAWWKNAAKHQYYQYTHCGPEGRYWFKGDGQFTGHYIGLHVGFGIYDLSWGHESQRYQGYQGEFAIALGISYGYTWKLGKLLHLEAGLGFGYIMTEYRRYQYIDECYVYQGTERMQFLGPTKARVALQWRLGTGLGKKKRGGLK